MDKAKFKAKQSLHGDTNDDLAKVLDISRHTLGNKINGKAQFRIDEVAIIAERYKLSAEETQEIFF